MDASQDLKKLFVLVPANKCATFRATYISPASGERSTVYDNKLVFLEDTHQLWTQGSFYSLGSSIANALTFEGGSSELTVELGSHSLTNENVGDYFVIDAASAGATDGKYHFTLGSVNYVLSIGDSVIIQEIDPTTHTVSKIITIERNRDGLVTASEALTANKIIVGDGGQNIKASSYVFGSDNVSSANFGNTAYTLATEQGVKNFVNDSTKITTLKGSAYIDITYSYSNGVYSYTAYAYTQSLIDATGITYDSATGKWVAADDPSVVARPGLAVAYDVAYELIKDERVIAAALNDHEERIDALENGGAISGLNADFTYESAYFSYHITETQGKITYTYISIDPVLELLTNPWESIA